MGKNERFTIEDVKSIALARGGILRSSIYINARAPLDWECGLGHRWTTSLMSIRNNGSWCPYCAGKAKKSIDFCVDLARLRGGKCLSKEYKNKITKMEWECSREHKWWAKLDKIQVGQWCPTCAIKKNADDKRGSIEDIRIVAEERGGRIISSEYKSTHEKLEWECALGHRWIAKPSNVKTGTWCPDCKGYRSERICRAYFEAILGTPFPKSYPKWLQITKKVKLELDGFSLALGIAFEHQGEQHYDIHRQFAATASSFKKRKRYDELKRKRCRDNGVILIEIPALGVKLRQDKIEEFIRTELMKNNIQVFNLDLVKINWNKIYTPEEKLRFERLKEVAKSRNGKLLSQEYLGQKVKHLWECDNSHQWAAIPESIERGGTWCAVCAKKAKRSIEELREAAIKNHGHLIGKKYFGTNHSYLWKCVNGHKFKNSGANILKGQWCGRCHRAQPNKARMSPVFCSNGDVFESVKSAAEKLKMHSGSIVRLLRNQKKSRNGLYFRYLKR